MRGPTSTVLLCGLLLGASACFEGPERLEPRTTEASAPLPSNNPPAQPRALPADHPPLGGAQLPEGHPPLGAQLPAGHPPLGGTPHGLPHAPHGGTQAAAAGTSFLAGNVALTGALGELREGGVFLLGRAPGGSALLFVRKLELTQGAPAADGSLELAFEVTDQDSSGVELPPRIQLEVYYDPDGIVETQEGRVRRTLEVERGDLELRLVLEPPQAAGGN